MAVTLNAEQAELFQGQQRRYEQHIRDLEDERSRARKAFQAEQELHRQTAWELEEAKAERDNLIAQRDVMALTATAWRQRAEAAEAHAALEASRNEQT